MRIEMTQMKVMEERVTGLQDSSRKRSIHTIVTSAGAILFKKHVMRGKGLPNNGYGKGGGWSGWHPCFVTSFQRFSGFGFSGEGCLDLRGLDQS